MRSSASSLLLIGTLLTPLCMVHGTCLAGAEVVAYVVPAGTSGNQEFEGPLGMDFDVELGIEITRLGVFDSGGDGLARALTARIYDRATREEVTALEFSPEDPGELVGGSRWKSLPAPLSVPAGFRGTIVAEGYGEGEPVANAGFTLVPIAKVWSVDDGNCSIRFVGVSRHGATPGEYPATSDTGPRDRYAAGTFAFVPLGEPVPRAGIAYIVPELTQGNLNVAAPLGLDFVARATLQVTSLGVFDDGSDGLARSLTVRLYDRANRQQLLEWTFTPEEPGELVGGSRFHALEPPVGLPEGFQGTIVAEGYGESELAGDNFGAGSLGLSTDHGGCVLGFGSGRRGTAAGQFPEVVEAGVPHRFAAGTFAFEPGGEIVRPEPPTSVVATPGDRQVLLEWAPPDDGVPLEGYHVYRTRPGDRERLSTEPVAGAEYTAVGLPNGVETCFVVRSVLPNGLESSDSEASCATPSTDDLPEDLVVAFSVDPGTVGTQAFEGSVGLDFDTHARIAVTRLGVFDDGSDGLGRTLTARLYDRRTRGELAGLVFEPDDPGELVGGHRLKSLPHAVVIDPGFRGSIVVEGYGIGERYVERVSRAVAQEFSSAGCAAWLTGSRLGPAGAFPPNRSTADVPDAFVAGTLEYGALGDAVSIEEVGTMAYMVAPGTAGNQTFGGVLGLDFNAHEDLVVTRLGVFDDNSDGLQRTLTARLFERVSRRELARLEFTPEEPGELAGGNRLKDLEEPVFLPAGSWATIAAEGYGDGERNLNQNGGSVAGLATDDGGCLVSFVGGGRYAVEPGQFPAVVDGGPPNRYAAGTVVFERAPEPPIEFVRGDSDASGDIFLTDGLQTLIYLFQSGELPACPDAADADDNGELELTDAVRIFQWLFNGSLEPKPPSPSAGEYVAEDCGPDPTADGLECDTTAALCH